MSETAQDNLVHEQRRARRPRGAGTLARSRHRVLAGVAGGIAEAVGMSPVMVRSMTVLLSVLSGGIFVLVYILLAFLLPEPDTQPR